MKGREMFVVIRQQPFSGRSKIVNYAETNHWSVSAGHQALLEARLSADHR